MLSSTTRSKPGARFPFNPAEFQCDSLSVRLTREDGAGRARVCIDLVDARAPFEPNRRGGRRGQGGGGGDLVRVGRRP